MSAVEHLGQALRAIEAEASEIEHRMAFVRAAIEAFGMDADSLLMDVIAEEERANRTAEAWEMLGVADAPETAQQDDPDVPYGRLPGGRWDWHIVAHEIGKADDAGQRRVRPLAEVFDVSAATAQWMVKRCRELSLIDTERTPVNHQAARDAAAAAL